MCGCVHSCLFEAMKRVKEGNLGSLGRGPAGGRIEGWKGKEGLASIGLEGGRRSGWSVGEGGWRWMGIEEGG